MADNSKIEWTDATWNPITGCSVVSPGCTNCYAMRLAGTRMKHHPSREGLTEPSKKGPVWNGQVRFNEDWLDQPLRWTRPRMVFVCAHGDLFHENIPDEWIDRVFAVMALAPQHTFQVLTKRADRMREYMTSIDNNDGGRMDGLRDAMIEGNAQALYASRTGEDPSMWLAVQLPLPNVWLGVSAEDQQRFDERVEHLGATPAAVRWISAEPLLGHIDTGNAFDDPPEGSPYRKIDWVVAGGESGPNARPMHPDWARSLRDQCAAAGVPFHFKQNGEWLEIDGPRCKSIRTGRDPSDSWIDQDGRLTNRTPRSNFSRTVYSDPVVRRVGKKAAGRLLDGVEHNGFPGGNDEQRARQE